MSGQFMYIQTVQSDTGTLNFYSFLNFIIIHQQLKQRTSIRIKNYFTDHIYSPQWQISGAGELEWLVWQSGVTGDWKKKTQLISSHRKNTEQEIHIYKWIFVLLGSLEGSLTVFAGELFWEELSGVDLALDPPPSIFTQLAGNHPIFFF